MVILLLIFYSIRITPMIWFGGLYQKPIISDYEEVTPACGFFVVSFFYTKNWVKEI